jgi:KUP system potassium uptake protein
MLCEPDEARPRRMATAADRPDAEGPLHGFVDQLSSRPGLLRVPGTAVFLNRGGKTAPLALRANAEFNHVLQEQVVIVTIDTLPSM